MNGFGRKRNDESGKITESTTTSGELSSFEQGICDYSTENFYPLTNISKDEKATIRKLLTEETEQNKADKWNLSILSSWLEKSYKTKNFIIKYKYLKESLKRFAHNEEKFKKLCTKLDIKDIQFNKKQESNPLSSCSSDDEGNIISSSKQHKKQNRQDNNSR